MRMFNGLLRKQVSRTAYVNVIGKLSVTDMEELMEIVKGKYGSLEFLQHLT